MSSLPRVKIKSDNQKGGLCDLYVRQPIPPLEHSSKKLDSSRSPSSSSSFSLQNSNPPVQSQTYSRTQNPSEPLRKPTAVSFHQSPRELVPRSISLLPTKQQPATHDLSHSLEQVYGSHSKQFRASDDAAISQSQNAISTSLVSPPQCHLPRFKSTTSLMKPPLVLTPQRQLMKPIEPPLPRSQTMGSLPYFAGDGTKETSSSSKSNANSVYSGHDKQLDVVEVLRESRMTDHEVEVHKYATRQTTMPKNRIQSTERMRSKHQMPQARESHNETSTTTNLVLPLAKSLRSPTGASRGFGKINVTRNEEMDRKLLHKNQDCGRSSRQYPIHAITRASSDAVTNFAIVNQQTPTSLTAVDSGLISGSTQDDEWEIDVKLVRLLSSDFVYSRRP